MVKHNKYIFVLLIAAAMLIIVAFDKRGYIDEDRHASKIKKVDTYEKRYDLPIVPEEEKSADADSIAAMEVIRSIYVSADKGEAANAVISQETADEMMEALQKMGHPVSASGFQMNMKEMATAVKFR